MLLRKGVYPYENMDDWKKFNEIVYGKIVQNVSKIRNIKLVTTKTRKNYLVSKPNFHTTKFFSENLLAIEMRKTEKPINKPVYLGLSILELRKLVMRDFWYDYVKPKYSKKVKLCYMDTHSFIAYLKTGDIYKDFAEDVETTLAVQIFASTFFHEFRVFWSFS